MLSQLLCLRGGSYPPSALGRGPEGPDRSHAGCGVELSRISKVLQEAAGDGIDPSRLGMQEGTMVNLYLMYCGSGPKKTIRLFQPK